MGDILEYHQFNSIKIHFNSKLFIAVFNTIIDFSHMNRYA